MEQIHSLLRRQLRQHFGSSDSIPKGWQDFIDTVNNAYLEFDTDRRMLERSLDLSSQELLQANSEMKAVFQSFPDLFFLLDTEGTILEYKGGNTNDFYFPPEKLLGKRIQNVPLQIVGNKFHEAIHQVQQTKSIVGIEYSLMTQGHQYFYEARLSPILENQIIVIVRNITNRKQGEKAIKKTQKELKQRVEERTADLCVINESLQREITERKLAEEELRILNTIMEAVHKSSDLREVFNVAIEKVMELTDIDIVGIYLVDKDTNEAVLEAHRGYPDKYIERAGRIPYPKGVTWKVITSGETYVVQDVSTDPYIGPAGKEAGFQSFLAIPIKTEEKTVGTVNFHSYKKHKFGKREIELFSSIGTQIAIAISKAKQTGDLQLVNEDLFTLNTIAISVHNSLNIKKVYDIALDKVLGITAFDIITVYLVDEDTNEVVLQAHRGLTEDYIRRAGRIPYPKGVTWKVINSGELTLIDDIQKDPDLGPAGRALGHRTILMVPIKQEEKTIGIIGFASRRVIELTSRDISLLNAIGNQIGTAIVQAYLYDKLQRQTKDLEIINAVSQVVHASFDLQQIYKIALDKVMELENVDMACIYLVDEAKNEALMQHHRNFPEEFIQIAERIPYPKGVTWKIINTGMILNVKNAAEDPDVGAAGRNLGFRSMLGIPISLEGKTIGVIWLLSYREYLSTKSEEELLTSIGTQIATAIAKARLYKDLSKKSRYETIIRTVTQAVHKSINLQDVLENAVETMSKNIDGVDNVSIYLVEGEEAVLKAHKGYPDWFIKRAERIPYPKGFTWKTIIEGKPRYVADAEEDTVIGPAGRELGTKSYVSMPIHLEGKTVGAININSLQKNAFNEEELKLLEMVAQQIEVAINNAQQAEALRESEERYRTLFNQSPLGVYIFDKEFRITQCNERMVQILQSSHDKILGLDMRKLKNQDLLTLMGKVFEGQSTVYEGFYEATISPVKLWVSILLSPLCDAQGNVIGGMAVVEDITEHKRIEEELIKTQKLESLGILAGGIAHDFNNLLTAILGNVSLIKAYSNLEEKGYRRLIEAEKASLRAKDLTQQLLTFAKGGAPVKKIIRIRELIKESGSFALIGSNVSCEFSIAADLWSVEVDEGQISQAINNLVINAQQAMPRGGEIRVRAENINNTGDVLTLRKGKYIKITIEDKGIGIPREHLAKLFDPYFTTKQKGSGLGLATTYSIIKNHDGYIAVESDLGVGTNFYIYLPASEKEVPESSDIRVIPVVGKGKVLVMDDEEIVRDVAGEILSDVGYEVEFTREGSETIELYVEAKRSNKPFDLVIMDLTIAGGIGGKETIKRLQEIDPEVKAIVSSGYSNDPVMSDYREYGFRGVLAKPYKGEELTKTVYQVIKEE